MGRLGIGSSLTGTCYGNCSAYSFPITTGLQLDHFSHHHQNLQHKFVLHCWVSLVDGIVSVTRSLFYWCGQRETTFWEVLPGHTAGGTAQVGGGGGGGGGGGCSRPT